MVLTELIVYVFISCKSSFYVVVVRKIITYIPQKGQAKAETGEKSPVCREWPPDTDDGRPERKNMKKYQKVIVQNEDGNVEVYEKAIVVTSKQEDKISLSFVNADKTDIVKGVIALTEAVDQMGLMPLLEWFLENMPVEEAEYEVAE